MTHARIFTKSTVVNFTFIYSITDYSILFYKYE